jgi:hypothetical protein
VTNSTRHHSDDSLQQRGQIGETHSGSNRGRERKFMGPKEREEGKGREDRKGYVGLESFARSAHHAGLHH